MFQINGFRQKLALATRTTVNFTDGCFNTNGHHPLEIRDLL
jgi:hypothetical protein